MTEKESALYSHYIIDGIRHDATPADLLDECMEQDEPIFHPDEVFDDIIDESIDPPITSFIYDKEEKMKYLDQTLKAANEERPFRMLYPEHFTCLQVAKALLGRLWSEGHFRLGDLRLWAQWEWNTRHIGSLSAYYRSVSAASEYIYSLGVGLADYLFIEEDAASTARFYAWLPEVTEAEVTEEDPFLFKSSPYESRHPWISENRKCPSTIIPDPDSWLIYIPFDTCRYKIGGSLLAQTNGHNGGKAPQIADPDYFIDCYEVVRELVEDGLVISGVTVADGGLATAAAKICGIYGFDADISGIASSYQENDDIKILFGEIPGVIIQVKDNDYDYVDSQLTLQDVAYYPIGHPSDSTKGLNILNAGKPGVAGILASLIGPATEGED